MFTLWRKLELAETVYFRPLAGYSSSSRNKFNQIDVIKKDSVADNREASALEKAFKSATNPLQILTTLPSNPSEYRTLSSENVVHALQKISTLQRANKDTTKCHFITSHPNFEQLCRHLKRCSNLLTADELVRSFKFLCSLNVPTNSEISLVLLNLIRHSINDLSVEKIIYLDYILSQTDCRSELQRAIQTALPLVFELQLPQQIDMENSVAELVSILNFFASHKGLDMENKNLSLICKMLCEKTEEINSSDAINIIYHLCAIDRLHLANSLKLITICIRRLMDQITDIDINELQKVVNRLVSTTVKQFSPFQFHIHCLLKSCADRISQKDLGLSVALSFQRTIKNISFQSTPLLKYIGDKLILNVDDCKTMSSSDVFTIIQAFANNCYIPETSDGQQNIWSEQILPAFLANENLAQIQPSSHTWLQFTLQLAILDYFSMELISRVFTASYLDTYLKRFDLSTLDLYKILILYQTVAMQPNINLGCIDSKKIAKIFKKYVQQMPSCDVQLDLIDHVGRACALTNVRTKYMHLIPTLIKVNKETGHFERFPEDIARDDDGFISLDTIPCGRNEILVCVDSLKRYHLFSNVTSRSSMPGIREITDDMKIGAFRLRAKQLESLGIAVCEINYRRFKNIRMGNKYQYLIESIRKCYK